MASRSLATSTLYDILIVGGGPAGLSAALCAGRQRRKVLVFEASASPSSPVPARNFPARHMHNFLSRDGMPPAELRQISRQQIVDTYGETIHFLDRKIVGAAKVPITDGIGKTRFQVTDEEGSKWTGRKLILATGMKDIMLDRIEGFSEVWEGGMMYHCLFCEGFETSHLSGAILGANPASVHFAHMAVHLLRATPSYESANPRPTLTLLTDGPPDAAFAEDLTLLKSQGVAIDERAVKALRLSSGREQTITAEFVDGPPHPEPLAYIIHKPQGVQHPATQAIIDSLGLKLDAFGCVARKDGLMDFGEASDVAGVYPAGDTATPMSAVINAAAEGTRAGAGAVNAVYFEDIAKGKEQFK